MASFQKHRRPDFQCGAKRRGLARFQQSSVNHRKKHRHRRRGHRARPKLCIGWHSTRPGTICPRTGQEASRRTDGNDLREPQRATQRWHRARRLGRRLGVPGLAGTIFTIGAGSILVGSILAAATVAGGALFAMGIKRLNLVNRFERYRDAIGLARFLLPRRNRGQHRRYNRKRAPKREGDALARAFQASGARRR